MAARSSNEVCPLTSSETLRRFAPRRSWRESIEPRWRAPYIYVSDGGFWPVTACGKPPIRGLVMLVITEADLRRVVDLDDVIESQRRAYRAAADGAMAAEGVLTAVHG